MISGIYKILVEVEAKVTALSIFLIYLNARKLTVQFILITTMQDYEQFSSHHCDFASRSKKLKKKETC